MKTDNALWSPFFMAQFVKTSSNRRSLILSFQKNAKIPWNVERYSSISDNLIFSENAEMGRVSGDHPSYCQC